MELKTKELAYLIVLAFIIASLGICSSRKGTFAEKTPLVSEATLTVHVAGAVNNPGVYTLPAGSRVGDAIDAAGGPLAEADIHRLNLAEILIDGKKVHVPAVSTESESRWSDHQYRQRQRAGGPAQYWPCPGAKSSNTGKPTALFSIEEITKVNTIGPKIFESIKDLITY